MMIRMRRGYGGAMHVVVYTNFHCIDHLTLVLKVEKEMKRKENTSKKEITNECKKKTNRFNKQ